MTARSLPPLPAALAAKLRPSPPVPVAAPTRPVRARKRRGAVSPRAGASAAAGGARGGAGPKPKPKRARDPVVAFSPTLRVVTFRLRTVNPLNRREHYRARAERVRMERAVTDAALRSAFGATGRYMLPPEGSGRVLQVVLTRISSGRMDRDGAFAALKGVQDAVAAWLGCDDADPRVRFDPEQDPGDVMAVRVEFVRDAVPCDCRHGWRAP